MAGSLPPPVSTGLSSNFFVACWAETGAARHTAAATRAAVRMIMFPPPANPDQGRRTGRKHGPQRGYGTGVGSGAGASLVGLELFVPLARVSSVTMKFAALSSRRYTYGKSMS